MNTSYFTMLNNAVANAASELYDRLEDTIQSYHRDHRIDEVERMYIESETIGA